MVEMLPARQQVDSGLLAGGAAARSSSRLVEARSSSRLVEARSSSRLAEARRSGRLAEARREPSELPRRVPTRRPLLRRSRLAAPPCHVRAYAQALLASDPRPAPPWLRAQFRMGGLISGWRCCLVARAVGAPQGRAVSPTGGTALVFHDDGNGEDVDSSSPFYGEYALTMIDLSDFFANPLLLPAEPTGYADTEDGETGFFVMDGEPYLEVLHYDSLLYNEIELKSEPVHLGVLPETRTAYISQEHDLGRISFFDVDADELQTITGFELNAGIQD